MLAGMKKYGRIAKIKKSVGPDIQKSAGIPSLFMSTKPLETQRRVQNLCRWSGQTASATTRESAANRARTQQPQELCRNDTLGTVAGSALCAFIYIYIYIYLYEQEPESSELCCS